MLFQKMSDDTLASVSILRYWPLLPVLSQISLNMVENVMLCMYSMKHGYNVALKITIDSILSCNNRPTLHYLCPYPMGSFVKQTII